MQFWYKPLLNLQKKLGEETQTARTIDKNTKLEKNNTKLRK